MPPPITPYLFGRRLVVSGLAATAVGPLIPGTVGLAQTTSLLPTPRQTAGPFYPVDWSGDGKHKTIRLASRSVKQATATTFRHNCLPSKEQSTWAWSRN